MPMCALRAQPSGSGSSTVTHVNQLPLLLASIITLKLLPCHTSDGRAVPRGEDSAIVNWVHDGRHGMYTLLDCNVHYCSHRPASHRADHRTHIQ